jgi:hypothetical protein
MTIYKIWRETFHHQNGGTHNKNTRFDTEKQNQIRKRVQARGKNTKRLSTVYKYNRHVKVIGQKDPVKIQTLW